MQRTITMDRLFKNIKYIVVCVLLLGFASTAYSQTSDEYFQMAKKEGKQKGNFAAAAEYCPAHAA